MNIAIPLFDRFTALDAVGPYEVLSRLPGAKVRFLARRPGPICTEAGLVMVAAHGLGDLPHPEVIVVPGGPGTRTLLSDETLLGWLRAAHETSEWTTSVCTGALLLGAAGLLEGRRATTHRLALDRLADFGAIPSTERVVEEGRLITAAGVSAGIDMALTLAGRIAGAEAARKIALSIEYHPEPPFPSSPEGGSSTVVAPPSTGQPGRFRPVMILRALAEDDELELRRIHTTPEVARWWDLPAAGFPWTDEPEATRLTIEVQGAVAGLIQFGEELEPKYRHATIDVFLDPALHGRGLGTEAVRRVVEVLLDEHGHHRITIDPASANSAAIRAYEKVGFKPVGVLRKYERDADGRGWHDGLLMELLAGEA